MPLQFLARLAASQPPLHIWDWDDIEELWALADARLVVADFPAIEAGQGVFAYQGPATYLGLTGPARSLLAKYVCAEAKPAAMSS